MRNTEIFCGLNKDTDKSAYRHEFDWLVYLYSQKLLDTQDSGLHSNTPQYPQPHRVDFGSLPGNHLFSGPELVFTHRNC